MPTISVFYGISILLRVTRKEHLPPDLHARYGEYEATFKLSDGNLLQGEFPTRAKRMVKEFIKKYKKELQHQMIKKLANCIHY